MRILVVLLVFGAAACAQGLSSKWEELTGSDFVKALDRAQGVCMLSFGILEKHGPTGQIGTDLLNVRYTTFKAVEQEYAIVFPEYYFGKIFEAKTATWHHRLQHASPAGTVAGNYG